MNYGVIGTGYWGSNHVRVASELVAAGELDEVVICDVDEERASTLADEHGVSYTTDYGELAVDAATVATPSTTHERIATDLLRTGTDVLVEKPLALTSDAAWNIVETAERHGRTLGVGHIFRYHPALRELRDLIEAGELGEIKYLHTARFSFRVPRETTGVLYSLAVHDVDVYDFLLGRRPDRVFCNMDSVLDGDVDETTSLTLSYGEATGVIHSSWQVPVFGKRRDLAVVGTEGAAYLDYLADTELELHDTRLEPTGGGDMAVRDEGKTVREAPDVEPLKAEVRAFVDACQRGFDPSASGRVGARTVEILERAEQADATDRAVPISGASITQ